MILTEREGYRELIRLSLPYLLLTACYMLLVLWLEEQLGDHIYKVPAQAASVFGLALAFFLGFRMNSAYDRWWEARKVIGELGNTIHSFSTRLYVYYMHTGQVRKETATDMQRVSMLLSLCGEYIRSLQHELSPGYILPAEKESAALLLRLSEAIAADFPTEAAIEKNDLLQHITRLYDIQGKAERIRNTPFLMIYSAFTRITVGVYVLLLPLFVGDIDLGGEDSGLEFLAVPIMAVISTVFLTIHTLANRYGAPFSQHKTSVPVAELCGKMIAQCNSLQKKISGME